MSSNPGQRSSEYQDIFSADKPYVMFDQFFQQKKSLRLATAYAPISLIVRLRETKKTIARLAIEQAIVEPTTIEGKSLTLYEREGVGGRVLVGKNVGSSQNPVISLNWLATGFTLQGNTVIISGTKLLLNSPEAKTQLNILASGASLKEPIFRIRRAYENVVTGEALFTGADGNTAEFNVDADNKPVCPCSVKINYTDSVGLRTAKIRDNGKGLLTNVPGTIFLSMTKQSTIDYKTGKIFLAFHPDRKPANGSNITIDYEHGVADQSSYDIIWHANL